MNVTLVPAQNVLSASDEVKLTTGSAFTVTFLVVVEVPPLIESEMVFTPAEE